MSAVLSVTAYVNVSGPLFDGTAERALADAERDARQAVADRGVDLLKAFPMDRTGRARGGFQALLTQVERGDAIAIPAPMFTGVTWGPWLEGVSSRNSSTRFKGYHLFRKTRQQLDQEVGGITERVLQRYLPEMGGTP